MRMFRRPALAVFVLVHLFPTFAWSQGERVGVVTTLEGNVTARRAVLPQPVPLKFKDDVFFRDTITTGDQSLARVEPIPASQIGQITAGLEGKGIQHKEAANQEQVKAQVAQATSAVLNAVLGGGVGAAIVAAENSRTLPQTQTAPIVPPIAQAL